MNDQIITTSTPNAIEQGTIFHYQPESDSHYHNTNLSTTLPTPTTTITTTTTSTSGVGNNNQNLLSQNQHNNTLEPTHSSLSSSTSNEIGNSQFYIDSNRKSIRFNIIFMRKKKLIFLDEHVYDGDKSSRKYDTNVLPGKH